MAGEPGQACPPKCLIPEDNNASKNANSSGSRRQKWHQKRKAQAKSSGGHKINASPLGFGGPGMQAFFLTSGGSATGSGSSSSSAACGTGFFLPRRPGTSFHPWHKPACATVLPPSSVVHALNLNAHTLGSRSGIVSQGSRGSGMGLEQPGLRRVLEAELEK